MEVNTLSRLLQAIAPAQSGATPAPPPTQPQKTAAVHKVAVPAEAPQHPVARGSFINLVV